MNQHDDSISESNVGGQNSLLSNPSENSSLMKNMQSLENLDKEKLAKEVSEILTNLPEIANASKSKPNVNLKNDEQQKEDLSENENSSNDDSLPTTSENEDESEVESSELDEESSKTLRTHCVEEISQIEKQFLDLRDRLHKERQSQNSTKSLEVAKETAPEYLQQLQILQQEKEAKLQVAQVLRDLRKQSLELRLKADKIANSQHLANEKLILKGKIQAELDEKIRRLEEDRYNVDTDYWLDRSRPSGYDSLDKKGKKNKKKEDTISFGSGILKRKKKPVTVTGPYIVYMLKDSDIIDDWAAIKRAASVSHRKTTFKSLKKRSHHCRYEDGKFYWNGKLFTKGQNILIKNIFRSGVNGTIVNLTATEILIRQNNGKNSKLHVHLLQRGKYSIQHR